MSDMNKSFFTGRFTRDPEVRQLENGSTVANFSLAVNESWGSKENRKERVTFIECDAWNNTANFVGNWCHKGDFVRIESKYVPNTSEGENGRRIFPKFKVVELQKLSWARQDGDTTRDTVAPPTSDSNDEDTPF